MTQYLLPCSCGQAVRITAAQAGEQVVCDCGKSLPVPTLRAIQQLQIAPTETSEKAATRWSPVHGVLFASGLTIATVGVIVLAYFGLKYIQLGGHPITRDITDLVVKAEQERIDELTPTQALAEWTENVNSGLGEREEPPWVRANKVLAGYKNVIRASAAALIVGALLALTALLLPRSAAA